MLTLKLTTHLSENALTICLSAHGGSGAFKTAAQSVEIPTGTAYSLAADHDRDAKIFAVLETIAGAIKDNPNKGSIPVSFVATADVLSRVTETLDLAQWRLERCDSSDGDYALIPFFAKGAGTGIVVTTTDPGAPYAPFHTRPSTTQE